MMGPLAVGARNSSIRKVVAHLTFAHSSSTYLLHAHLFHTQLLHTNRLPTQLFNIQHFHTQLCYPQLFHRPVLHIHSLPRATLPDAPPSQPSQNSSTIRPFTHNSCTELFFVFPAFSIPLQSLFVFVGSSWLLGLSGPVR